MELTAGRPTARVPLFLRSADVLEVTIRKIDNPRQQAIVIHVVLELGSPEQIDVGAVAPFPSDQTGTFVLPVPPAAQAAIAANHPGTVALIISLASSGAGVGLESPLSVSLEVRIRA